MILCVFWKLGSGFLPGFAVGKLHEGCSNTDQFVRNQAEHYSTTKNIANLSEEVDKTKSTIVNDDIIVTHHDKCQMR